ncbi:MAG TPA: aminotransferase class IV [Caulifigura sp.]|nr:aminotransferase class IV [Caulifigura sp.]
MDTDFVSCAAEPLAYLNGEFVQLREARLPVWDLGLVQGATITEAIRTFRHQPFRLEEHLDRLEWSLQGVSLEPKESIGQIRHLILELVRFNATSVPESQDLLVNLFVTAGESQVHSGGFARQPGRPTVGILTRPLSLPATHFHAGISLAIPAVRHIPPSIIDPRIKYRSRLHWHLAEIEARKADPQAEALLLDLDGFVTETARGNMIARFDQVLKTPSEKTTLAGVSQQVAIELLRRTGLAVERANMTADELANASEILLTSTTACVVPVTRLNGRGVGDGRPGPTWRSLISDWSEMVGVDIVGQASASS